MNSTTAKHIRLLYILTGLLAIFALISLFAGCSSKPAETPTQPSGASQLTQTPPPVNNFIKQFGDVITWDDGTSISVSAPAPFEPTAYAAGGHEGWANLVFEIVMTNGTDEPMDPFSWPSLSSGGQEAATWTDIGNPIGDIGMGPTTSILPGQSVKWLVAYAVADPSTLTFQIMPQVGYEEGIFTNIPF